MSLTKNPIKPMMQNPMAVAMAIFWNSADTKRLVKKEKASYAQIGNNN